jgi:hypothetical protein
MNLECTIGVSERPINEFALKELIPGGGEGISY